MTPTFTQWAFTAEDLDRILDLRTQGHSFTAIASLYPRLDVYPPPARRGAILEGYKAALTRIPPAHRPTRTTALRAAIRAGLTEYRRTR